MITNIFKTLVFVMVIGFPTTALAESSGEQQGGHNHKMSRDMKGAMDHDMTSMMDNMEGMHIRMKNATGKMKNSALKADMIEIHQEMTQVMGKMKMMHKNMNHKTHSPETKADIEKMEHNHKN